MLVLVVALLAGYGLSTFLLPPPRDRAVLWDDYVLATAAIYQRDGDVAAARERLQALPTDDPEGTVAALAAVYVPEGRTTDDSRALANLATALTGRSIPVRTPVSTQAADQPLAFLEPLLPVARSELTWSLLSALSVALVGLTLVKGRRRSQPGAAQPPVGAEPAPRPAPTRGQTAATPDRPPAPQAIAPRRAGPPPMSPAGVAAAPLVPLLSLTFTYAGGSEPVEEIAPIRHPGTGKVIACCGLSNGPPTPEGGEGYLGFLVWLHEMAADEVPQTVGLTVVGVRERYRAEMVEWAAYAHLRDIVLARPGTVRVVETRQLRATMTVVELTPPLGQRRGPAIARLSVRLDVALREAPA